MQRDGLKSECVSRPGLAEQAQVRPDDRGDSGIAPRHRPIRAQEKRQTAGGNLDRAGGHPGRRYLRRRREFERTPVQTKSAAIALWTHAPDGVEKAVDLVRRKSVDFGPEHDAKP